MPGYKYRCTKNCRGSSLPWVTLEEPKQVPNKRVPKCRLFLRQEKMHININFFVRLVLGRPRVCPGDFTRFVPGTSPGFLLILHSGSPANPGLSLGQSRGRRAAQKVYVKKVYVNMCLFRSLLPKFRELVILTSIHFDTPSGAAKEAPKRVPK